MKKPPLEKGVDYDNILTNIEPTKLTESHHLNLDTVGWGMLTDYYLESVKSYKYKGKISSTAIIKIGDKSGHVTCVIKGPAVGLLFGLSKEQWREVERLTDNGELFYRYFKNGLNDTFNLEQKIFYYFCATSQRNDALIAVFKRKINTRQVDKNDPLLEILELKKCNDLSLELYQKYLRVMS